MTDFRIAPATATAPFLTRRSFLWRAATGTAGVGLALTLGSATSAYAAAPALGTTEAKDIDASARRRVPAAPVPQNPFMAPNGRSNIHDDAYMTDTYETAGPPGGPLRVQKAFLGGLPATITFDSHGRINALAVIPNSGVRRLALLDPDNLSILATYENASQLPPKADGGFGGGGYFYLDQDDRLVVPTVDLNLAVFEVVRGRAPRFEFVISYALRDAILQADGPSVDPASESILSALPDWSGRRWFVTKFGVVGYLDPASNAVLTTVLVDPVTGAREQIHNSFAMDETGGVYVVSDYALYRFDVGASGAPTVTWREAYDRGTRQKPGQMEHGSGTTPTLQNVDDKQFVAITDNADPYMHVLVYRRERSFQGTRLVCEQPVFGANSGFDENSLIGAGRSLIAENNYGYVDFNTTAGAGITGFGGMSRVDFDPDGSGGRVVWTNPVSVPTVVSKMSLADGLIYTYTKKRTGWYLTAIDFFDGRTVFEQFVGFTNLVNNNYAGLYLGPNRHVYVGVLSGIVSVSHSAVGVAT